MKEDHLLKCFSVVLPAVSSDWLGSSFNSVALDSCSLSGSSQWPLTSSSSVSSFDSSRVLFCSKSSSKSRFELLRLSFGLSSTWSSPSCLLLSSIDSSRLVLNSAVHFCSEVSCLSFCLSSIFSIPSLTSSVVLFSSASLIWTDPGSAKIRSLSPTS